MTRNLGLLICVLCSALATVTVRNRSTSLFQAIEAEKEKAQQLNIEFNQLKAERDHLAAPSHIERTAREKLRMQSAPLVVPPLALAPVGER